MKLFPVGHATHPQWQMAAHLALAQLRAQMALPGYASSPTLGLLYITSPYVPHAQHLLDWLAEALPGVLGWAGAVGAGVAASNAEYLDEPALSVMLCELPPEQWRVFSGVAPLRRQDGFSPQAALVHADAHTPDVAGLIAELADCTACGHLFGGLAASRGATVQMAASRSGGMAGGALLGGVFSGGLTGVAFGEGVPLITRITQGCHPVGPWHTITRSEGNMVFEIDGEPALDVMLDDMRIDLCQPQQAMHAVRQMLVGLCDAQAACPAVSCGMSEELALRHGRFGADVLARHLVGIDPGQRGLAVADAVHCGQRLAFCQRDAAKARADLRRICSGIRDLLEPAFIPAETAAALAAPPPLSQPHPARRIAGAIYVSCASRGGPHFGHPGAELQTIRQALGDVPLTGFFSGGEIASRRLLGYAGVLTVFVDEAIS